jgi:sodium-dependent phosphate cotransporter
MDVQTAIPVIMGANIGTSVTNTIVAMGQASDSDQFEKAFAGATVHDMFNFLSVLILLPLESVTHMIYWITFAMTPDAVSKGQKWVGPIKKLVGPFVDLVITVNALCSLAHTQIRTVRKCHISMLSFPLTHTNTTTQVDKKIVSKVAAGATTCAKVYEKVKNAPGPCGEGGATALIKCSCHDDGTQSCPAFFIDHATKAEEMAAGAVTLSISLVLLCLCLGMLVKVLQSMVMGTSAKMLRKSTNVNGYLAMLIGMGLTILVQSSSITTSVLTPLVGVGVLPLSKMYPLSLGANIGTTFTAILASLVSSSPAAVQIALCHLFFNLIGICIWYPIPFMRNVPINAALGLGAMTRRYKSFPLVYIITAFVIAPALLLGVSTLYEKGNAFLVLGVLITIVFAFTILYFLFWFNKRDGKNKIYAALDKRQQKETTMKNLPETLKAMQEKIGLLEKSVASANVDKQMEA